MDKKDRNQGLSEQITPQSHPELFEKVGVADERIDTSWVEKIGFWSIVWEQFRKNRFAMAGLYCVALLFFIAVYAPLFSSGQPFFCYFKSTEPANEFDKLDADQDKHISRKEFGGAEEVNWDRFNGMDANRDGKISEWEWKGGIKSPWAIALFDRRINESGVDIFFNLIMVLSPLYLLAWFLLRKKLGKAMSVYFIQILAGFALVQMLVFLWMMHDGVNFEGIPIFFHLGMIVIPIIFLFITINIARGCEGLGATSLYALSAVLAIHLTLYLWGALATFGVKAPQIVAGKDLPVGTGYYSKVFHGGYRSKPTPYYQEFQNKISRRKEILAGHKTPITAISWSPDSKWIASVDMENEEKNSKNKIVLRELKENTIRLCNPFNGVKLPSFSGHEEGITSVAWRPDSKVLATGSKDCTIRLWSIAKRKQLSVLRGHEQAVTRVAFGPSGDRLVSASEDGTIRLWNLATGLSLVLEGHDAVTSVVFNRDGDMLASASMDGSVRLWDLSGAEIAVIKGHGGPVNSVSFSPDGKTLATCSDDKTVRLWDVNSRKQLAVLDGHEGKVTCVRFSPDGKRLASASVDKTILLWDVEKKKRIDILPRYAKYAHTRAITGISWSPSGNALVSCSLDRQIYTWNVRPGLPKVFFLYPLRAFNCNDTDTHEENPRPPGDRFWLGTNSQGKDVMTIMIYGTRISLTIGVVAVSIYITIGIILGSIAGFSGGKIDLLISRFIEVMLCFPTLFLILTIVVFIKKPNIFHIMVVIGVTRWTTTARLVRAEFLRLRNIEYVQAAIALGFKKSRIMFGHVLPNALGPVLVAATFGVAASILIESTLAFLGLGDQSAPSWGLLLKQGYSTHKMWLIMAPGLAIFFVVSVLNLVGEGLRDALDPKLRQ